MDVQAFRSQIVSLALLLIIYLTQCTTGLNFTTAARNTKDILSTAGVWIRPQHTSHVKLALADELDPSNNTGFRLSFDFRTPSADGIVFYGRTGNPYEVIALTLKKGYLRYKVGCLSSFAEVSVPTHNNSRLNDRTWHTVAFRIETLSYGRVGHLYIDGHNLAISRYLISCGALTTLVMGGHSEEDAEHTYGLENLAGHFKGCIKNLVSSLREPPKYYSVSVCK